MKNYKPVHMKLTINSGWLEGPKTDWLFPALSPKTSHVTQYTVIVEITVNAYLWNKHDYLTSKSFL